MAPHAWEARELLSPVGQKARQLAGRHWRPLLVVVVAALAIVVALLQPEGEAAERRALQSMPQAERQALYDEMLRSTQLGRIKIPLRWRPAHGVRD
jgi:hypothetical protein